MARHHRGRAGCEEENGAHDLLGLGETSHRRHLLDALDQLRLLGDPPGQGRPHSGRRDRVHADPLARPVHGERGRHVDDRALGRLIRDVGVQPATREPHDRCGVDDTAAASSGEHVACRLAGAEEHPRHVDRHHLVPVVERDLGGGLADRDSGVVEEAVEPAVPGDDLGKSRLDLSLVGDVHLVRVAARGGDIEDRDAGAHGGEGGGHGLADAAGAAGDDGHVAVESEFGERVHHERRLGVAGGGAMAALCGAAATCQSGHGLWPPGVSRCGRTRSTSVFVRSAARMKAPPISDAAAGRSLSTSQTHSGPSTVSSMPMRELCAAGIDRAPAMKNRKPAPNCPTPKNARSARSRGVVAKGSASGSATAVVSIVASTAAGAIWTSGCRRTRTVAVAKLAAMTTASRSPVIAPRPYESDTMITAPARATPIMSHVSRATRSPSSSQPSSPATYGPVEMRMSVLATDVWASERMKHVEASAMHKATATTGRPPSRHCATIPRPRTIQSTRARKTDAKKLRHRVVVQALVVTRRAMSPPLLQHNAAQATSRAPRRASGVVGARRRATESGADVMSVAQGRLMARGGLDRAPGLGLAYGTLLSGANAFPEWRTLHEVSPIRGR